MNAIFESPFHLRPPVPVRNFRMSPQDAYPSAENKRSMYWPTACAPPRTSSALRQLRTKLEQVVRDREGAECASGDMSKNKDRILWIPESKDGACVRV